LENQSSGVALLSVFSLVNSTVNLALPAFAAERRAAAPLPLSIDVFSCPHSTQHQTRSGRIE